MALFSFYDKIFVFFSFVTYVTDVGTDIAVVVYFFSNGHLLWGILSLVFVVLAALTIQVISLYWHLSDRTLDWIAFVSHILFIAPLQRYLGVLQSGFRPQTPSCHDDLSSVHRALNDVCILRLFETFIEAVPLLVLQLYVILSDLQNFNTLLGFSTVLSLISIAWAITAYSDGLHLAYNKLYKRRVIVMLTHMFWQTGMVTARVGSIVLLLTVAKGFMAIPLGIHLLVMLIWIIKRNPEFGTSHCERGVFILIAAIVHMFCFLNLKDGRTRYKMVFFYILSLAETIVFMTVWYMQMTHKRPVWFDVTAFSVVFGAFAIGTVCMLLYYGCCHHNLQAPVPKQKMEFPHQPVPLNSTVYKPQSSTDSQERISDRYFAKPVDVAKQQSIFDVSSTSAKINLWLNASLNLSGEGLLENPDCRDFTVQSYGYRSNSTRNSHDSSLKVDMNNCARGDHNNVSHENKKCNLGDNSFKNLEGDEQLHCDSYNGNKRSPVDIRVSSIPFIASPNMLNQTPNSMSGRSVSAFTNLSESKRTQSKYMCEKEEQSLPKYNLIEMFARCKVDPSFVSDTSLSDSSVYPGMDNVDKSHRNIDGKALLPHNNHFVFCEQDNSITENSPRHHVADYSVSLERQSLSSQARNRNCCKEQDNLISEIQAASYNSPPPVNVNQLLEESQELLPVSGFFRPHMPGMVGSDISLNQISGESSTVFKVTSDALRGISCLSLTYTAQNEVENPVYGNVNGGQNTSRRAKTISSHFDKHNINKSVESINSNRLRGSKLISLLDLSLQLPYSSCSSKQIGIKKFTSDSSLQGQGFADMANRKCRRKSTPLDTGSRSRIFCFDSRDVSSQSDRRFSSLSDRGLSSSDRGLSSTQSNFENFHQSFESSGFQSEDSKPDTVSPTYGNVITRNVIKFNSSPLVENEISSIYSPQLHVRDNQMSLNDNITSSNSDVSKCVYSTPLLQGAPTTCMLLKSSVILQPTSLFSTEAANESNADSPVLPPLLSRHSSATKFSNLGHRFFTDPSLDDSENQSVNKWDNGSPNIQNSIDTGNNTTYSSPLLEKSSLSALISDMSSSKCGGTVSSDETQSLASDPECQRPCRYDGRNEVNIRNANSLSNILTSEHFASLSRSYLYEKLDKFETWRGIDEDIISDSQKLDNTNRIKFDNNPSDQTQEGDFDLEYSSVIRRRAIALERENIQKYENIDNLQHVIDYANSPYRQSRFRRGKWKNSPRKEIIKKDRLFSDNDKLAPKNLHLLLSKTDSRVTKLSPLIISEYSGSPYKYRHHEVNFDDKNVSEILNSCEINDSVSSLIASDVHSKNMSGFEDNIGPCPIATPESLSDSEFTDQSENMDVPNHFSLSSSVRNELCQESLSDGQMTGSNKLMSNRSPVNTSGFNSAFTPVRGGKYVDNDIDGLVSRRDIDNEITEIHKERPASNATFTVLDENLDQNNVSLLSSNKDRSLVDSFVTKSGQPSSRVQSDVSQCMSDSKCSSFQWSQNTSSNSVVDPDSINQTPKNYLELAGFSVLGFSKTNFSRVDTSNNHSSQHSYSDSVSCSQHSKSDATPCSQLSYSDSIPWEDSQNRSNCMHVTSDEIGSKSLTRQPLKALENTPIFSPIYGQDKYNNSLSHSRFMSTPKISAASAMNISTYSEESVLASAGKTYCPKNFIEAGQKSYSECTSSWSMQIESDIEHTGYGEHSRFSSLSKTTYI